LRNAVLALVAALGTAPHAAGSDRVDGRTLEERLRDADLIGIVECEMAGIPVARYRVIESWKGPEAGARVTIRVHDLHEPCFPPMLVTLVGQRYYVIARREGPRSGDAGSFEGPNPIAARELLGADYVVESHHDRELLHPPRAGRTPRDLPALKASVTGFLGLTPEARELRILQVLSAAYGKQHGMSARLGAARSVEELACLLVGLPFDRAEEGAWDLDERLFSHVGPLLVAGGEAATLALLEKQQLGPSRWAEQFSKSLRARLHPRPPAPREEETVPLEEVARLREWLLEKPASNRLDGLLEGKSIVGDRRWPGLLALAREAPAPLADALALWQPGDESAERGLAYWRAEGGYCLGSWFGRNCGKDRAANLSKLLEAKDPYVRTAGAVFLCYEDEAAGREALRQCLALEGDPGGWAALTLARRGEKAAVPRLIRALSAPGDLRRFRVLRLNLLHDAQVLFSNTAAASGLPLPPTLDLLDSLGWGDDRTAPFRAAFEAWWKEHGAKANLADPWLPLCAEKRVD
jgi:hypothetical protein